MSDQSPVSGFSSDADFARAERALELGWVTKDQLEAAIVARDRESGSRLLAHLPLSPEQFLNLEQFDPTPSTVPSKGGLTDRPSPPAEVLEAMKIPQKLLGSFVLIKLL